MLPISLQDQIVSGTLEHTISRVVDEHIDLSVFDARYNNDETGATAIHPKILLKVILLANARGMISSRQSERGSACGQWPRRRMGAARLTFFPSRATIPRTLLHAVTGARRLATPSQRSISRAR